MVRSLICFIVAVLVFFQEDPEAIYALTSVFTSLVVVFSLLNNRSRSLIYPFQLGALLFIFPDGFTIDNAILGADEASFVLAAKYICVSVCMLHCGYWLIPGAKPKFSDIKEGYVSKWALFISVVSIAIYLISSYQFTVASATEGRAAALDAGGLGAMGRSMLFATAMVLPALVFFVIRQRTSKLKAAFFSTLLSLPIFISLILQGNRFPLFYCMTIFISTYQPKFLFPSIGVLRNGVIVILAGLLISTSMVKMRDEVYGISDNGRYSLGVFKSEGILNANVSMVKYFAQEPYTHGASLGGIFLFWVPRAIWPEKPQLLGYWLPREYSRETLSDSHSVGFGFSGNGYADFGFYGGVIISLFIGAALAVLDRSVARLRGKGGFSLIVASTFLPFSFFLARNLDTGIIIAIMLLVLCFIIRSLLFRRIYFRRVSV